MPESTFIRLINQKEQKEVLVKLDSIWKIEVEYGFMMGQIFKPTDLVCQSRPDVTRVYTLFFGGFIGFARRLPSFVLSGYTRTH